VCYCCIHIPARGEVAAMSAPTGQSRRMPLVGSLANHQGFPTVLSKDLETLVQQQGDALKWSLALHEAIKSWTDEHAVAVAQTHMKLDHCLLRSTNSSPQKPKPDDLHSVRSNFSSPASARTQAQGSLSEPLLSDEQVQQRKQFYEETEQQKEASDDKKNGFVAFSAEDREQQKEASDDKKSGIVPHRLSRAIRVDQLLYPTPNNLMLTIQGYLNTPAASVESLYNDKGICQACARSNKFNNLSMLVIMLNTIWIAVDTDYNKEEILCNAPLVFQVMDNLFCAFFCVELFIRLMAYRDKLNALRDPWYIFDGVLVLLMVWETWIQVLLYLTVGAASFEYGRAATVFRVFRLARLTRVARTGKLLRSAPELMILSKAIVLALRSVMAVLVMLTLVLYVFAILFVELLSGSHVGESKFENVPQAMNYLLIQLLCGFDVEFMTNMVNTGLVYYVIYLIFVLLANMTIMNMLIGILCEVVAGVSEAEKEDNFLKDIKTHLNAMSSKIDADGDKRVSREEFLQIMTNYELVHALNGTGVDVIAFVEYASFVYQDEAVELSCDDFIRLISQFRGNRVATVKELVGTRKYLTTLLESLEMQMRPHGIEEA